MADVLGYCMGVRKAMEKAVDAASLNPGKKIYSAGPLIHNPNALKKLENLGIGILKTDTELENSIVIIRAHGIPPEEKKRLSCSGAELVDATCPRVLSSQRLAEKYYKEGYQVFLAGDKNHGEIEGLAGFAPGCIVLENPGDAENLNQIPEKSVLIGQTTIKDDEYQAIAGKLKFKNPGIIICNTLCPAAGKRQAARAVLHVKGRRVGRLAGKILHRHLIRAGCHRRRRRGKRHFLLTGIRAVVVHLQRAAVRVYGGNVGKLVGKLGRRQRQFERRAKQPGGQVQQHGGLGGQHGGKQFVAPQKCGKALPCFHVTGLLSRPRS